MRIYTKEFGGLLRRSIDPVYYYQHINMSTPDVQLAPPVHSKHEPRQNLKIFELIHTHQETANVRTLKSYNTYWYDFFPTIY